jgi:hypothetical protein
MALPVPQPGLVISYSFLWRHESGAGRESGAKDRPCAIVLTTQMEDGDIVVLVAPITHTPPSHPDLGVELPTATKQRLGLDEQRSWVVVSDLNKFVWPGPDLRPIAPGRFDYGLLPASLFEEIRQKILAAHQAGKSGTVQRTE